MFGIILFWLLPLLPPAGTIPANVPVQAPSEIVDVWLRFHETELCQDLDARFVFHPRGVEVWCLIEDEKAFEKFTAMLEPLRQSYEIEVYPTRPAPPRKSWDQREPLPSLWNNDELRAHLFSSPGQFIQPEFRHPGSLDPDYFVKQRLILFEDQTLAYEQKMTRYGSDLPSLTYAAGAPGMTPEQKSRLTAIAAQHALELDKCASRLMDNLQQALPRAPRKKGSKSDETGPSISRLNILESASQLARLAQATARRIFRFLNPQRHTVELSDLKEPSLLESIRRVRTLSAEFRDSVKESGVR
jgi:hypothetical protein